MTCPDAAKAENLTARSILNDASLVMQTIPTLGKIRIGKVTFDLSLA